MATRSFAYDHPAYTVPGNHSGSLLAGASALSQRFVAHANLTLKAAHFTTVTIGTGAATDAKTLFVISQGTATTTTALFTTTAAIYSTRALVTNSMARGDVAYVSKGTDATEVGAVGLEYLVTPGADVTA